MERKEEQSKVWAHLKAERDAGVKCKDDGIRVEKKYYKDTTKKASKLTSSAAHHLLTHLLSAWINHPWMWTLRKGKGSVSGGYGKTTQSKDMLGHLCNNQSFTIL